MLLQGEAVGILTEHRLAVPQHGASESQDRGSKPDPIPQRPSAGADPLRGEDSELSEEEEEEGDEDLQSSSDREKLEEEIEQVQNAILSCWISNGGGAAGNEAISAWFKGRPGGLTARDLGRLARNVLSVDVRNEHERDLMRVLLFDPPGVEHVKVFTTSDLFRRVDYLFAQMQVQRMLQATEMHKIVSKRILDSISNRGAAFQGDDFSKAGAAFQRVLGLSKHDLGAMVADAMPEIVDKVHSKMQKICRQAAAAGVRKEGGFSMKFMGDSEDIKNNTFEAKFGGQDVFHGGLDKVIGLPDPNVFQAIMNEHEGCANSRMEFKTDNYGLTCTPIEEVEAALNPICGKEYPNNENYKRRLVPIRIMLSAAGCFDKDKEAFKPILEEFEAKGVDLEMRQEDKVDEALSLLMVAHQGMSSNVQTILQRLESEGNPGIKTTDEMYKQMKQILGWGRKKAERAVKKGRRLLKKAQLRPEEVLGLRLYTVRLLFGLLNMCACADSHALEGRATSIKT